MLGEKHPDTIRAMVNLAINYHNQGCYTKAEKLEEEVLTLRQQTLRVGHPSIKVAIQNLSATYKAQGRHDEAK